MGWFGKTKAEGTGVEKRTLGEGIFRRCEGCGHTLATEALSANLEVCPNCGHHHRMGIEAWRDLILDPGSWSEVDQDLLPDDPLSFKDTKRYRDQVRNLRKKNGLSEALVSGSGAIEGRPVELGLFLFRFLGGSMGSVVGEKLARLFERAAERPRPVIVLNCSGGARMQEGVLSLMQMAKTVAALNRFREVGMPYISILLNPTTGGVAASIALLGDVNIAEPRALIGFAGPRVIQNTIRQELPEGFQRAEFLLEHGMVDMVVERKQMRSTIARLLSFLVPQDYPVDSAGRTPPSIRP
jgi:acetyl-CoA carboxylase carboxyl transferase subunit beta